MKVYTKQREAINVTILDSAHWHKIVDDFNGKPVSNFHKKSTSRTYELSDRRLVIELYDRQGILIKNEFDFDKLKEVRFMKNTIDFLKKSISYKIELSYQEGNDLILAQQLKKIKQFKSDLPEYFDFEVYQLANDQILYLDKSKHAQSATIFQNLKTLASENENVLEQLYGSEDEDYIMKRLAAGDSLPDYDLQEFWIYPKYEKDFIKNQRLTLIEKKVFVSNFYGNLYRSPQGKYMVLDDFDQLNVGKTAKIGIGTLRVYSTLAEVKEAQKRYEKSKDAPVIAEHFYKKMSDEYKEHFVDSISQLIATLPTILNFDEEQLTFDESGMAVIDESLKWHSNNSSLYDTWYPAILAYYGEYFIRTKKTGKWTMSFDKDENVWIPHVTLADGSDAFDVLKFYKDMYEGPIPLAWGEFITNETK